MGSETTTRLVVGMSGASGAALTLRLLKVLEGVDHVEVHLVVTDAARQVMAHETGREASSLEPLVTRAYGERDISAPVASGSFRADGMVVIPCSMKALAGVASGYAENLLLRAADVTLKERRPLVLVTRETPLSLIHLENMRTVTRAGATVLPPVLTMYTNPATLEEAVDQVVGKVLDVLGIHSEVYKRWA